MFKAGQRLWWIYGNVHIPVVCIKDFNEVLPLVQCEFEVGLGGHAELCIEPRYIFTEEQRQRIQTVRVFHQRGDRLYWGKDGVYQRVICETDQRPDTTTICVRLRTGGPFWVHLSDVLTPLEHYYEMEAYEEC